MPPLLEKCSMFKTYYSKKLSKWCFDTKHPETIHIVDFLQVNWQSDELVNRIRSIEDKSERDPIKMQLWGMTPASIRVTM